MDHESMSLPIDQEIPNMYSHTCPICERTFSTSSNMKRHLKQTHTQDISNLSLNRKIQCPMCTDFTCRRSPDLIIHLEMNHGTKIETEYKKFVDTKEFETWKIEIERQTRSAFRKPNGKITLKDGSQKHVYNCSRSGHYKAKGTGTRAFQGSKKINSTCPAKMTVTFSSDETIDVEFVKTHCGHPLDEMQQLPPVKAYKLEGARKLPIRETNLKVVNDAKKAIISRHLDSLNMSEYIIAQGQNGREWDIFSSIRDDGDATSYTVKVGNEDCNCYLRCELCNKCVHNFQCSCPDYAVTRNMCKHVHFICKSVSEQASAVDNLSEPNSSQNIDLLEILINENGINKENEAESHVVVDSPKTEPNLKQRSADDVLCETNELYRELVELCDSVELAQELKNILNDGKSKLQTSRENARKKNNANGVYIKKIQVPPGKIITSQRFKSMKKEPQNIIVLNNPSPAEQKQIFYTLVLS